MTFLYAVRVYKYKAWHVVRFYDTADAARNFASAELTDSEWDVKEMSLAKANEMGY